MNSILTSLSEKEVAQIRDTIMYRTFQLNDDLAEAINEGNRVLERGIREEAHELKQLYDRLTEEFINRHGYRPFDEDTDWDFHG